MQRCGHTSLYNKVKPPLCLRHCQPSVILYVALGLKISRVQTPIDKDTHGFGWTAPLCWHKTGALLITRLKLVRILAAPQPPNTLSKSDSSQNEMFFQEKEMKTLSPSLFFLPPFFPCQIQLSSPPLPASFYYSHTLTHYLFHTLFLPPVLSHLSPLSSPGTSMCFSLIEMHFNVVQISFLQLQSKLATCVCGVGGWGVGGMHVCVIYICVCGVRKAFPQLKALPSCQFSQQLF